MKVTFVYTPEGGVEAWRVDFDPEKPRLTAGEAVWLERHMGDKPIGEIFESSGEGSMTAMLAILFVYRKRDATTLRNGDFEDSIVTDDLSVEFDDEGADPKDDDLAVAAEGLQEAGLSPNNS